MMYSALFLAATAAVASAQVTYDPTSGTFICPADKPNGAFCAGDSLSTNIIIRCNNGVGQPGNCNDNLAGYFPFGVQSSPCWQSSPTSGIAACSKNCIVQGSSGTYNGTFTLPNCTAIPQSSSSSSAATTTTSTYVQPSYTPTTTTYVQPTSNGTTTITSTGTTTTTCVIDGTTTTSTTTFTTTYCPPLPEPTTTKTHVKPTLNGTTTITSTGTTTTTCVVDGTTTTSTSIFTTTYCPPPTYAPGTLSTLTSTYVLPSGTGTSPSGNGNGTVTVPTESSYTSATATPVGPTASATTGPVLSNGAMANSAGAGLGAMCLFIAYFL